MYKHAWAVLVLFFASSAALAGTLDPIAAHKDSPRYSAYAQTRCADFVVAVTAYAQVLSSNPVFGRDATRKAPFQWVFDLNVTKSEAADMQVHDFVQAYLDVFGPVVHPTLVPNLALYQSDKALCLATFGPSQ